MTDVAGRTDRGLVRERNEDRWLVREYPGGTLLAVADGVGGEEGGEVASAAAVEALAAAFQPPSYRDVARTSLSVAVEAANKAVLAAAKNDGHPTAATTLVAAAVQGRQAAIANLGDSRAYVVRGSAARQITTDHSGDRPNGITRFAGDPRGVQPDIFVETLEAGDRIVLCSDGLTRHVADEEIAASVSGSSSKAAETLVALAKSRGGEDNVTVVVYAAGRPLPRALFGTLLLALLLAVAVAGTFAVLLSAPVSPVTPTASAAPAASAAPTELPSVSPVPTPGPSATP